MKSKNSEDKLIEIFLFADDLCLEIEKIARQEGRELQLPRRCGLCMSEMLAILVFYHHSGYKCFQYYYEEMVMGSIRSYFPGAMTYKRFLDYIPGCLPHLFLMAQVRCAQAKRTGIYFVDSKKLPVCDNRRIHSNKVFKGIASRGKSSTGWFYGLKLHLVINNLGQVVQFFITPANVADNNLKVLEKIFNNLQGFCLGDKGYLTKYFEHFFQLGLQIVTKIRNNMKNQIVKLSHKLYLMKRGVIESVNDILMTVFDIDHTRHRSPINAICHIIGGLVAYDFYPDKPAVVLPWLEK
jgi:hypothetical protein